jgi:hypothetical protein
MKVGFTLGSLQRCVYVKILRFYIFALTKSRVLNLASSYPNPNGFRDKKMLCDKIKIYVNTLNVMLFIFKTKNWLL